MKRPDAVISEMPRWILWGFVIWCLCLAAGAAQAQRDSDSTETTGAEDDAEQEGVEVEALPLTVPDSSLVDGVTIETVSSTQVEESEKDAVDGEFLDMSLSDLLNIKVESVSKNAERTFDAPLSATVLTGDEIRRSGARTIMEALRLAPGLIVREQTTGNYDVHIRGLDNVPPNTLTQDFSSSTMLVMIDYRVVYSYFQGGTFWQTLPVDLAEVDRIEIIRGPASALYGPNAVTGVINIITRHPEKEGFYTSDRIQYGLLRDERVVGVSGGYDFGKVHLGLSGNYHHADRTDNRYFSYRDQKYYDDPADLPRGMSGEPLENPVQRYPRLDLAIDKIAANATLGFDFSEHISLEARSGYENSRVQRVYADTWATPLSTDDSESCYLDFVGKLYGATARVSYALGDYDLLGTYKQAAERNVRVFSYGILDADLDYDFRFLDDILSILPALSFRRATYDSPLIADHTWRDGRLAPGNLQIIDSDKALTNLSGSLRGDLRVASRWRFVVGVRVDGYLNRHEDAYYPRTDENMDYNTAAVTEEKDGQSVVPSWQLATTWELKPSHLLRVSYSRAHRSPFLFNAELFDDYSGALTALGNRALDLLTTDVAELGYRAAILDGLEIDAEVFYSYTRGFSEFYTHAREFENGQPRNYVQADNIDTVAHQAGLTMSALISMSKARLKVFFTAQETLLDHHAPYTLHVFDAQYDPHDPKNQRSGRHEGTPSLYGGLNLDIRPMKRLGINTNLYGFTGHTQIRADQTIDMLSAAHYEPRQFEVQAKAILDAKITFGMFEGLNLFLAGYNLLFQDRPEFLYADRVGTTAMAGAEVEL